MHHRREPGGGVPSRNAIFVIFLEKKVILMSLDHILQVFRAIFKEIDF